MNNNTMPRRILIAALIALACPREAAVAQTAVDSLGDPLPAGAIARLGTVRFRHGDQINAVAVSPDSKTIATGARDGTLALWDLGTGKDLAWFRVRGTVFSVAFSPDG